MQMLGVVKVIGVLKKQVKLCLSVCLCLISSAGWAWQQEQLEGMNWREVGPYRGGRSAAVAGIPQDRNTYYFGSTGGGVWKTQDAGEHWKNISDGFFGGSIGAVAVSAWDPNVIYVGTGEKTVRGNVSHGKGLWKSTDAGRSWQHIGLDDSRHIPRIRIHPRNPDLVYVAAMGHLYGANEQRGVFRSKDGGASWEKVLYVNDEVGAVDLVMDPTNPRVLYASTWRIIRRPYSLESGGEGSGLWKSTDGGDTWESINEAEGLPDAPWGISGITVSPSNPDNLYAIIEAKAGGVFRSRDGGKTWRRTNQTRKLRQRAWYYSRIVADPSDEDAVYVLNVRFHRSSDGGRTFERISTPHGDNHDLWIDPNDPLRMIQSNDGGANVSFDGGQRWSLQSNQPTAQMYRVSVDNDFPYRLLGGQQDNSAIRIRSRSARGRAIGLRDWDPTAGGESGHIVAKPDEPDVVYGGSYGGYLIRLDHRTGDVRAVNVWPNDPMGWGAAELKYRFNWNFPLMFSPHDTNTLYAGANVLFKTTDGGQSWSAISDDLTRNLKDKQGSSGGPITKDNTSVEYYGTIFAIAESKVQADVLWTGSDDGLLHVSRDGGLSWAEVTPEGLPEEVQINALEAHPLEAGGLYLAATAYKSDDFTPYLFKTTDYGKSWKRIVKGIPKQAFTRVIRADAKQAGLLFAGTEEGLYVSSNDGRDWQAFQLNLPIVPITDLAIKGDDLIAATQGRGYWILDDIAILRQLATKPLDDTPQLFEPAAAYRLAQGSIKNPVHMGQNPPAGVRLRYWLPTALDEDAELSLAIFDAQDDLIRRFVRKPELSVGEKDKADIWGDDDRVLSAEPGMNEWVWDLDYPAAGRFKGLVLWNDDLDGARAVPGAYRAELSINGESQSVAIELLADPRVERASADYQQQFEFVQTLRNTLDQMHRSIRDLRQWRQRIKAIESALDDQEAYADLIAKGQAIVAALNDIEKALYQTQLESPQDPLNFPIRLNDKLAGLKRLASFGDHPPTQSMLAVRDELMLEVSDLMQKLAQIRDHDIPQYNRSAQATALPAVILSQDDT
jgi:photosystem II stability/assembly factor-like uncharacterized protein